MIDRPSASDAGPDPLCAPVSRRRFIAGLGATVAVVAAGGFGISVWERRADAALPPPPPGSFGASPPPGTLVVVEMGGGNDGLSMVVPHASPAYHDLRAGLAVTDPLDLDGEIGLNPALTGLAGRYAAGEVAIVEGVGYPDPDLSHFASMSTWWSATPGAVGTAGWLGRYLDGTVGDQDPLAAIAIGPGPAPALLGNSSHVVSIQDHRGLDPHLPPWIDDPDELIGAWAGFAAAPVDSPDLYRHVQRAIATAATARSRLDAALGEAPPSTDAAPVRRRASLATSMDVAARLVLADDAPRVVYVHGFGDFDTHQGQTGRHATLMAELDDALTGFFATLEGHGAADRALVMTASEFGRRARSNGSGTDHGTAASHLLIGRAVVGGRYGAPPDLRRLDAAGNVDHTVDFRDLYATVLESWLGVSSEDVLGAGFEVLPLLGAYAQRRHTPI